MARPKRELDEFMPEGADDVEVRQGALVPLALVERRLGQVEVSEARRSAASRERAQARCITGTKGGGADSSYRAACSRYV